MLSELFKEFRAFLVRGNVVDLAVAVVIGAAFTSVVNSMVRDLITPLISAIGGNPDFSRLKFTIRGSVFNYGDFLNALISFVIIAAVVFFLVVQPVNQLIKVANRKSARGQTEPDTKDPQLRVLEEIRDALKAEPDTAE
jgi:large conductance mechanosensitive channel